MATTCESCSDTSTPVKQYLKDDQTGPEGPSVATAGGGDEVTGAREAAGVIDAPGREAGYLLGHSALEHRRLLIQASYVRPWTTRFLHRAGVSQGMSVLDIG